MATTRVAPTMFARPCGERMPSIVSSSFAKSVAGAGSTSCARVMRQAFMFVTVDSIGGYVENASIP